MVRNTISDAVIRVKNGYLANLSQISIPHSKKVLAVMEVLVKHKYLKSVKADKDSLVVELNYPDKKPAIIDLRNISVPGKKVYTPYKMMPKVWGGLGINVLTTNKGVLSDKEARKLKVGGEILLQVW